MKIKNIFLSTLITLLALTSCLFISTASKTVFADGEISANSLPAQYCMRDEYVVLAQNQDSHGYCWNFASTMAMATTIMKATGEYYDFSELWTGVSLNVCSDNHKKIGAGGSYSYQYDAVKESGFMLECDLPYQYSYLVSGENATDYYNFFERYSNAGLARCITRDSTTSFDKKTVEDIKKHIVNHGSVYLTFTFRTGFIESNGAYYLTPNQTNTNSNHAVSVIGWDDDYQKEFYLDGSSTPTVFKGAWIILNSYTEKSGKDGLSYVFYDDSNIGSVQGYRYEADTSYDLYFYDKIESGYQFTTDLKGSYYGDLTPTTSLTKQKNIFYDDVNLEYSYVISDGASVTAVDIFLGGRNVTKDFTVKVNDLNKKFTISRKNAPYGQYKIIVTYGNGEKSDTYLNNFFVTHGIIGEEIEYDYENTTFTFNPGRDLEYYSFIKPDKNFVIYTDELSGQISFLQTETSVYSENNCSIPTIYYQITNGESCTATYEITSKSGYTLPYNFTFEYCEDESMQPVNVYYDLGGGVNHSKNFNQELANDTHPLVLYAPTREGYTFDGWYLDFGKGNKKVPEADGLYQVSWEDIHHMGENPSVNASSYYKNYYNNSNTLFVYARWKEIDYYDVSLNVVGNGKAQINQNISVCSGDSVRYIFSPDSFHCLSSLSINGEDLDGNRLIEAVKYGLLLNDVTQDLSVTATFTDGVYLSLNFGENVKTAYLVGVYQGAITKFYDGDCIPSVYFQKNNVIFRPRKDSSNLFIDDDKIAINDLKKDEIDFTKNYEKKDDLFLDDDKKDAVLDDVILDNFTPTVTPSITDDSRPPIAFVPAFSTQFSLVVELYDAEDGYTYVLDGVSGYTPTQAGVFQKTVIIQSKSTFAEFDVGSAVKKPVEPVEINYDYNDYLLDHYLSDDINATSGEKYSATFNAGQIVYLFVKPFESTSAYKYTVYHVNGKSLSSTFKDIGDGWFRLPLYVNADEPYLGKVMVYRETEYYTVSWRNWDGTEIVRDKYGFGEVPVYDGDVPQKPDDGIYAFVFAGWDKPLKGILGNTVFTATYTKVLKQFSIAVTPTDNGVIESDSQGDLLTNEDTKTYTFTPNDGYEIKDVLINGVSVGRVESYTFTGVTSDQTLEVQFEKKKYALTVICGENGIVDYGNATQIEHGASVTLTITPSEGYSIGAITLNGEPLPITDSLTIDSATCDIVIEITFTKNESPSCGGNIGNNLKTDLPLISLFGILFSIALIIKKSNRV